MSLNPMASRRGRLRTKSDSKRGDRPNLDSLLENLSSALKPTAPVPSVPIRQPTGDEKLEDFLQDSEGLEVFSAFLKGYFPYARAPRDFLTYIFFTARREYSSENVEFWLAVERFREIGDADRIKAAELIMKLFIRPNGDQEVNIKYQLKDNLIHQFEAGEVEATMFDTTQYEKKAFFSFFFFSDPPTERLTQPSSSSLQERHFRAHGHRLFPPFPQVQVLPRVSPGGETA